MSIKLVGLVLLFFLIIIVTYFDFRTKQLKNKELKANNKMLNEKVGILQNKVFELETLNESLLTKKPIETKPALVILVVAEVVSSANNLTKKVTVTLRGEQLDYSFTTTPSFLDLDKVDITNELKRIAHEQNLILPLHVIERFYEQYISHSNDLIKSVNYWGGV